MVVRFRNLHMNRIHNYWENFINNYKLSISKDNLNIQYIYEEYLKVGFILLVFRELFVGEFSCEGAAYQGSEYVYI